MKVMIMAGGTGGHIFPAAAVAEAFESHGYTVRWLGSRYGMEGKIVPKLGFEFCALPVTAWHGGIIRKMLAPFNLLRAIWHSLVIFQKEKPDAVVGFGGYPSAPGGIVALLQRRPLVLHEQNGVPGLTNAKLANLASRVLQAFPKTFKGDAEVVGNPVRSELCALPQPEERQVGQNRKLRVLILGGSQGAAAINTVVPKALELTKKDQFEIWHQAGTGKSDVTAEAYLRGNVEATVVEFIDNMADAYRWADFVIARSGASTVSELAAVGVGSLLIPYPWHKDKQQYRNAQWLVDGNAAEWIEQEALTPTKLADYLTDLNGHRDKVISRSRNAWALGVRDSAKRIVKVVDELIQNKAES